MGDNDESDGCAHRVRSSVRQRRLALHLLWLHHATNASVECGGRSGVGGVGVLTFFGGLLAFFAGAADDSSTESCGLLTTWHDKPTSWLTAAAAGNRARAVRADI